MIELKIRKNFKYAFILIALKIIKKKGNIFNTQNTCKIIL